MFTEAVLCLSMIHFYSVAAEGECTDFRGRVISHGLHYVPGPDTCTLCVCDNGESKECKAVLCSPPQDCRSFRVGNTCCEFICLDDVVKPAEGAETNVRFAAGGAASIVLLTVALVVYRLRKQKRRRPPHTDDQRSLTSIGYISGSMGYMGGTCETALSAWKPPTNYLPRGEAPPPYDEAVAQCRPDGLRMTAETTFHRTYPATVETSVRPEESMQCTGHGYANLPRPVQQFANSQNCYNAPLLQPVLQPEPREPTSMPHHPLTANVVGFPSAIRLTGSLGAISNRGLLSVLQREPDHERPHNVPGFYSTPGNPHASLHRTIPRISTAAETSLAEGGLRRADRSLHGEIRRSFHRAGSGSGAGGGGVNDPRIDTGRSVPRNLDLASSRDAPPLAYPLHALHALARDKSNVRVSSSGRPRAHSDEHNVAGDANCPVENLPAPATQPPPPIGGPPTGGGAPEGTLPPPQNTLPLTVDKPSCVCSYEGSSAPGGSEETDDYRSECENCKSASSSRWVLEEGWEAEGGEGTQTLQRRAPLPVQPAPATATLPQPVTKQSRAVMGPPSNWENWFNTIPDSDTESEEE